MSDAIPLIFLLARAVLAALFLVAGIAKLFDRSEGRRFLIDFGVPEPIAIPLAILLPLFELLIGACLVLAPIAWFGALGALSLLTVFLFAIGINLARGRRPDCHCFGQLHSAPVGWPTLARNVVFALLAAFVVYQGPEAARVSAAHIFSALSFGADLVFFGSIFILGLIILQALLLFLVLRQQGRLLLRLDALEASLTLENGHPSEKAASTTVTRGLPVGTHAPSFRLSTASGEIVSLKSIFESQQLAILIFTNPKCGPCLSLMPDVRRWERQYPKSISIVLISEGTADDNLQEIARYGVSQILLQEKREVAEAYLANGTPAALAIRVGGIIASPLAFGADGVRSLLERSESIYHSWHSGAEGNSHRSETASGTPSALKLSDKAPNLEFRDTNGQNFSIANFRGKKTILIFWNPSCHFCREMLIELRALENDLVSGDGNVVLISSGGAEAHRGMEVRSKILLDENFTASAAFGARGTPTALLLDADGTIASDVVAGASRILELARRELGRRPVVFSGSDR